MQFRAFIVGVLAASLPLAFVPPPASADEAEGANWKRGRIYYRSVCSSCHKAEAERKISPMDKTIAEWNAYFDADKHGDQALKFYVSREYRDSVKDSYRVVAKFIDLPDEQLWADLRAWVTHGAKDSDTPARCN